MKILVRDNWLKEPEIEQSLAYAADYAPFEYNGVRYQGIAPRPAEAQENAIREILGVTGGSFTTFWRRYVAPELLDEDPNRWKLIHTDAEMGQVAAVLFLTPPEHCRGGLAFWRHKAYGWLCAPGQPDMDLLGLKDTPQFWSRFRESAEDPDQWEMVDYVPMEFNRLVIFNAHRWHSRWPAKDDSQAMAEARLIKAFFWRPDAA